MQANLGQTLVGWKVEIEKWGQSGNNLKIWDLFGC